MTHVKMPELRAALPFIQAAPKDNAPIETLCFRPDFGERVFADRIELSVEDGVVGDRWKDHAWLKQSDGTPDNRIQVCILSKRVLELIWTDSDTMPYPGDTIITDMDLSEDNLPIGSVLQVGSALLRVSDIFNDACTKWQQRYGNESVRWINQRENKSFRLRGIFCEIIQNGEVALTDKLKKN